MDASEPPEDPDQREAQGNAGAFLSPYSGMIPFPVSTADQDPGGSPAEPPDPAQVPDQPQQRSLLDRLLGRNPPPPRER
jgi:hypothetical protein